MNSTRDPAGEALLRTWLPRIDRSNLEFRAEIGATKFRALGLASAALAAPRILKKVLAGSHCPPRPELQRPWLPYWPRLTAKPLHDESDYDWTTVLRQASHDIRRELQQVQASF